jgi:hypothetical protein
MSTTLRTTLLLVLSTLGGSACLTGRAQTPADRPALNVPAPPDRVIPQVPQPEPPPAMDPVADIPPETKPASPTRPNKPAPKPEAKPENKPETPPVEPPASPPQPAQPQIRLPETGDAGVVSRQIRDTVERARRLLGQTNRAKLTPLRQKAFDDAQLFVKQAEEALNANNLVFAKELADKAERLAKEVQSR